MNGAIVKGSGNSELQGCVGVCSVPTRRPEVQGSRFHQTCRGGEQAKRKRGVLRKDNPTRQYIILKRSQSTILCEHKCTVSGPAASSSAFAFEV